MRQITHRACAPPSTTVGVGADIYTAFVYIDVHRMGVLMPDYCVNMNAQAGTGDHEVHDLASTKGCLPSSTSRILLGWYSTCDEAVRAAKKFYSDVNGCYYCAYACHTT